MRLQCAMFIRFIFVFFALCFHCTYPQVATRRIICRYGEYFLNYALGEEDWKSCDADIYCTGMQVFATIPRFASSDLRGKFAFQRSPLACPEGGIRRDRKSGTALPRDVKFANFRCVGCTSFARWCFCLEIKCPLAILINHSLPSTERAAKFGLFLPLYYFLTSFTLSEEWPRRGRAV